MTQAQAYAKLNLGLVVGPLRADGKHELVTLLQRVDLHDDLFLDVAERTTVEGFAGDTIVTAALEGLARAAGIATGWRVAIDKRIPVAAGLGGGSTDAAAALQLANATLASPLEPAALHAVAAGVGADVPFFLGEGAALATGDGTDVSPVDLPAGYTAVLVVPAGVVKESTGVVYESFDRRSGAAGFDGRASEFERVVRALVTARDLALLPPNDLASSPLAAELVALGAFRADVTGAGPTVYGLFDDDVAAARAGEALGTRGRTYVTRPV
jgi:4-diphosphocytidyl-2-C-methyl-D-erythritol kinase